MTQSTGARQPQPLGQGHEFLVSPAEVQDDGVETALPRNGSGLQDRFRVLLVADTAREEDQEGVGGQVPLHTESAALVGVGRSEERRVYPVVEADVSPFAVARRDFPEIRPQGHSACGQPAVEGHHPADRGLSEQRLRPANLPSLAPATKVFDRRDGHVRDDRHAAQPSDKGRVDRAPEHFLRDDGVELPRVAPQPAQRPGLESSARARNLHHAAAWRRCP